MALQRYYRTGELLGDKAKKKDGAYIALDFWHKHNLSTESFQALVALERDLKPVIRRLKKQWEGREEYVVVRWVTVKFDIRNAFERDRFVARTGAERLVAKGDGHEVYTAVNVVEVRPGTVSCWTVDEYKEVRGGAW